MNTRGDEDGAMLPAGYESGLLGQSPAVKRAAARLAGLRGRSGTPAPTPAQEREASYRAQTGRASLTPAQARRASKKQNRAAGGRR